MKQYFVLLVRMAVITIIFGTIEVVAQQNIRMDANDPQIQLAQDAAVALDSGQTPASLTPGHVDMANSLAPFVIIYDTQGRVVSGSGTIHGVVPAPPIGVLRAAHGQDYNFVSWEPTGRKSLRIASVETSTSKYYVLSGRNLREVEAREQQTMLYVLFGWVVAAVVILATAYLARPKPRK